MAIGYPWRRAGGSCGGRQLPLPHAVCESPSGPEPPPGRELPEGLQPGQLPHADCPRPAARHHTRRPSHSPAATTIAITTSFSHMPSPAKPSSKLPAGRQILNKHQITNHKQGPSTKQQVPNKRHYILSLSLADTSPGNPAEPNRTRPTRILFGTWSFSFGFLFVFWCLSFGIST